MRNASWLRAGAVAAGILAVLAAGGAVAYRVLAPAETITEAAGAYPAAPAAEPGVIASLPAAPLIVDGRLRVYAATRQVRADGPVDARTQRTPYWSYRRWPQQLLGVVAAGSTVVSRWSDGDVVALDARTGRVAWRSAGRAAGGTEYGGGSTGARAVYAPEGLLLGGGAVLVRDAGQVRALDLASGRELWRAPLRDCQVDGFTTAGGRFAVTDTCAAEPGVDFYDLSSGRRTASWRPPQAGPAVRVEPLGCAPALSGCAAIRTSGAGGSKGWLVDGPQPVAAPALDPPESSVVGDVAVDMLDGAAVARSLRTGAEAWRWRPDAGTAELLAVQPGAVHLLTGDRQLVTLDPATGTERSRFVLAYGRERTNWVPGHAQATDGFVVVERLIGSGDGDDYFSVSPVLLARG